MALIGEMHYLTIGGNTYAIPTSGGSTVSVTRALTSGTKTATISVDGTSYDLYAPTPNAGTVTKVTAGTGLSIGTTAGGNFTTSGTINHTNSVTAQTTQAVYPIKIDAQGHISAYGTAVTSMPASDVSAWAKASTKPSYTFSEIGSKPTTLSGYGITDAYTKTQVDGLVSGVLHYKGTKDTVSALPTSGNTTGDVWHVTADGSEWAWDGSAWQELGTAIDLSGYAQLAGASFTGPVTFGDSVTADELETGDLVVTGAASFTNNIAANTINGVAVGTSPKFTDTTYTNISEFTNDAGYITSADVPEGASAYTGTISAVGTTASNGTSNGFARGDHVHNITGATVKSALGTGSGTTKFLREDGSWATPAYTTNTDTKLQVAAVTSGTTYYPIVGTGTTAATRQYDTTGFIYKGTNGTTSTVGSAQLTLGNSTASGTANNKQGQLIIYGSTAYAHTISGAPTAARTLTLPNKTGTIALTSDIPDISGLSTKPSEIANSSSSTVRLRFYNNGSEFYDGTGASYSFRKGTASSSGSVSLILGNSIASGTDGSQRGSLDLYGDGTNYVSLYALSTLTSNRTVGFPDKSGTVALISDIPTVPSSTGSATTGITASTTATKTTLGTAFTIPNVTSAGSASTWAFEDIACDDITSWSAGSGSASISGAVDSSDSTQLNITISHTHTAPSLSYTARTVSSKKSGANGSAPTLGTAFTVPNVTGNTSAIVSITDNGHTHTI